MLHIEKAHINISRITDSEVLTRLKFDDGKFLFVRNGGFAAELYNTEMGSFYDIQKITLQALEIGNSKLSELERTTLKHKWMRNHGRIITHKIANLCRPYFKGNHITKTFADAVLNVARQQKRATENLAYRRQTDDAICTKFLEEILKLSRGVEFKELQQLAVKGATENYASNKKYVTKLLEVNDAITVFSLDLYFDQKFLEVMKVTEEEKFKNTYGAMLDIEGKRHEERCIRNECTEQIASIERIVFERDIINSVVDANIRGMLRKEFKRFLNNRRGNTVFTGFIGYIAKMEHNSQRGHHIQLFCLFKADQKSSDPLFANRIGEYWAKNVMGGNGGYFNYGLMPNDKSDYKFCLGLIGRDYLAKRNALLSELSYFCKKQKFAQTVVANEALFCNTEASESRGLHSKSHRVFFRGEIPKSKQAKELNRSAIK